MAQRSFPCVQAGPLGQVHLSLCKCLMRIGAVLPVALKPYEY